MIDANPYQFWRVTILQRLIYLTQGIYPFLKYE